MAFTAQEKTAIRNLVVREGGLEAYFAEVRDLDISDQRAAALAALNSAVTVTVTDWQVINNFVPMVNSAMLVMALDELRADLAARDPSKLGALLIIAAAAAKKHLGR